MRWQKLAVFLVIALAATAPAQDAKIIKVLPHFLDLKGRASLSPSLFDRDAYQQELRGSPTNRSALRFDVQWKARGYGPLTLRIDAKGGQGREPTRTMVQQTVKGGRFSKWTPLPLSGTNYVNFGDLVSWRATLLDGTNVVAEQNSFLW